MINICKRGCIGAFLLAFLGVTLAPLSQAKPAKTEDELIADLSSPKDGVATEALQKLEKVYPDDPKAIAAVKKALTDPREKVHCKAARVLGALHIQLDQAEINTIYAMLKSTSPDEVMDALKALRGLTAADTVGEILPLLQHSDPHVIRDTCRTLAVVGNKSNIPAIEPLLKHQDPKVRKDAQDAIFALNAKS
jgi:HEAT repeat protein